MRDYSVQTSNRTTSFLESRGLSALAPKLEGLDRYAVTGSMAGPSIAPVRLAMIYVDDTQAAASTLDLTPTEGGANIWLLEPYDDLVFDRTQRLPIGSKSGAVVSVAPSQAAADLMTSPGRGPEEGEALIEQMKETENDGAKSPDSEYVAARRVLLDALEAFGAQRKALVLVGAQATV